MYYSIAEEETTWRGCFDLSHVIHLPRKKGKVFLILKHLKDMNQKIFLSLLSISLITILMINLSLEEIFASPPFEREEIKDDEVDWMDMNTLSITRDGPLFTDISHVTYFSDGNMMNSTLWLNSNFRYEPPINDDHILSYGMLIDVDSNKKTGVQGIDYMIEIKYEDNMWTKVFEEWSSSKEIKTVGMISNYTGFFEKQKKYVLLSSDLNKMGSPSKYKTIFFVEEYDKKNKNDFWKIDLTNWVYMPPPEFTITTNPTSLVLFPGEEKIIEVQVSSSTGFEPKFKLFSNPVEDITLNLIADELIVPSYGIATVPLQILVSDDAIPRPYTVQIFAESSFSAEQFVKSEEGDIPYLSFAEIPQVTKHSSFTINVNKPLSGIEKFEDFFDTWGAIVITAITILGAGVGFAKYLNKRIKNNPKKNSKK